MWRRSQGRHSRAQTVGRSGKVSLGGSLTGLMVALSATFIFAVLAGAVLQAQGHDLNRVIRGDTAWASTGAGVAFALAVFLSFLWGGYTSGRMGGGAGAANGALVPSIALFVLAVTGGVIVGFQGTDSLGFPFGVGNLPLDANLTPLGIALLVGVVLAMLGGGIWGGVIGARWHLRLVEELHPDYTVAGTDPFSDLSTWTPQ